MLNCVNLWERLFQICTHKETDFLHRLKPTDSNGFAVWIWPCVTISSEMPGPGPPSSSTLWDVPGGPVVKTSCSTTEVLGSILLGGLRYHVLWGMAKKKKNLERRLFFAHMPWKNGPISSSAQRRLLNGSGTCSLGPTCLSTSAPP